MSSTGGDNYGASLGIEKLQAENERLKEELKEFKGAEKHHARCIELISDDRAKFAEKVINLQRKLDLAVELENEVLNLLLDRFLLWAKNGMTRDKNDTEIISRFGFDAIQSNLLQRRQTPLVEWTIQYFRGAYQALKEIGEER